MSNYIEILLELGTLGAEEMIKQLALILAHTAQEVAACTDLWGKEQRLELVYMHVHAGMSHEVMMMSL